MSRIPLSMAAGALALATALIAPVAQAADAQRVVRDPETGALRAPTAEEAAALQNLTARRALQLRAAPAAPLQKFHASGARGVRLTDEFMSYSVMVRQADGTLAEQCFGSQAEADAAVKAGAQSRPIATSKLETE